MNNIDLKLNDIKGINMSLDAGVKIIKPEGGTSDDYSTEETIIGTWFGETLYRKVVVFDSLPNNNYTEIQHNIPNIDLIVNMHGVAVRYDGDTLPIPYITFNDANMGGITIYADKVKVLIRTVTNRSNYRGYVTLEYTKEIN